MSAPLSAFPLSSQNVSKSVPRQSANYHPCIWGDHFLSYASDSKKVDEYSEQQAQKLKEEVRTMLHASTDTPSQKLKLINEIDRLGVSYHFESEIDEILHQFHYQHDDANDEDLEVVALRFRLLRLQGHKVSCGVFNKFKDAEGNFKESLASDVGAMLSLYEATHLSVHGEDILDEALVFTTTQLQSMAENLSPPVSTQVKRALYRPLRKAFPRLEARHYISFCEQDASYNYKLLLTFAKLDFNNLQIVHQNELANITKWWKDLGFSKKLPFARDRLTECYFWILGVYFEPQYFIARKILTKVTSMTSVIDDIYDVYGTIDELEIFTDAIKRWDISCIHQLPEYMQICYKALLDVYEEIETELANQGSLYRLDYAKEMMKKLVQSYFDEAKWAHEKYIPTMDEYMEVSLVSSGYSLLSCTSFVGMGEMVTKETFDWLFNNPKIVRASSIICRLMDDMVSSELEQQRNHVASATECYMKQHGVRSVEEVHSEFRKQVVDAWKDINEEFLRPTDMPLPVLTRVLNLARAIDVIYKDADGYTNPKGKMKNFITALLVDSIPI